MRKSTLVLFLFTCMLLSLPGCAADKAEPSSEHTEDVSAETVLPESSGLPQADTSVTDIPEESGAVSEITESKEATRQETSEPGSQTPSATEKENPQSADTAVPSEPKQPSYTQPEHPAENTPASSDPAASTPMEQPAESSAPNQPQESAPEPDPEPEPEAPAFDIGYWISYAQSYAESVGLTLDPEAVYCWDNPITAGSHCLYLERDISDRLGRYGRDNDITAVWIWAESRGDGSYDLYIGYA